ncbi:uncharacterized protein [Triticum aestivum]|uniref:uncharacterized protein n=1 Tax=Triticum aestivum TaxID=4565 RepID=UPI001D02E42E|nr:uncharacterized protein LOC123098526 [Triticum aestivum]
MQWRQHEAYQMYVDAWKANIPEFKNPFALSRTPSQDKLTDLAKNGRIWSRMERLADLEQTVVTITKELKWKGSWKKRWNDNNATLTCGCCMYLSKHYSPNPHNSNGG